MSEQDPKTKLHHALGRAYSAGVSGKPRSEIVGELRSVIAADEVASVVDGHLSHLEAVVSARSVGGRCGCHLSSVQLTLLREALNRS